MIEFDNVKIYTDYVEPSAMEQIRTLSQLPAFYNSHIRIMPDVHAGKGSVIGFTAHLNDKVIPNVVGVDIGCGVLGVNLGKKEINLEALDKFINEKLATGKNVNSTAADIPECLEKRIHEISKKTGTNFERHLKSIGSLGSGNHFIELGKKNNGDYILIIHSGSRNFGLQVAKYHQNKAEEYCKEQFEYYSKLLRDQYRINTNIGLKGKDIETKEIKIIKEKRDMYKVEKHLAFLENGYRINYFSDLYIAQNFAKLNRLSIARSIVKFLNIEELEVIDTVHNYISFENNNNPSIIRKGAISAKENEYVLIPMNMQYGTLLCKGKGNKDWNESAPHGAGRLTSRSQAKNELDMEKFKADMQGIYTTSVCNSTLDEAPDAYKLPQDIIDNIEDTVSIVDIIKPVYNFKAK